MDKNKFKNEIDSIEVPTIDVLSAIDRGIDQGKKDIPIKRGFPFKKTSILVAAAASLLVFSGFFFKPVTNVLAELPILGGLYEKLDFSDFGEQFAQDNLISGLNMKESVNGVDITVTGSYYCDGVIGIFFKAEGDSIQDFQIIDMVTFSDYKWESQNIYGGTYTKTEKKDNAYVGLIELQVPEDLPNKYELPFTFTFMRGVVGNWKFSIPVEKTKSKLINVYKESSYDNGGYKMIVHSVKYGPGTSTVKYKLIMPKKPGSGQIYVVCDDNKGQNLNFTEEELSRKETEEFIEVEMEQKIVSANELVIKPLIENFVGEKPEKWTKMDKINIDLK